MDFSDMVFVWLNPNCDDVVHFLVFMVEIWMCKGLLLVLKFYICDSHYCDLTAPPWNYLGIRRDM